MSRFHENKPSSGFSALAFIFLVFSLTLAFSVRAAQTGTVSLASSPLTQSVTTDVMPNLMFVLDDSGSMDWDYMPDVARNFSGRYGFNSSQCNGTYYNPAITYSAPLKADGTAYSDASFSAAWRDGYDQSAGTVNLNTGFTGGSGTGASGISLTAGPAFYYTYSGTQTTAAQKDYTNTNSIFYRECNSTIGSTTQVDGSHPVNTLFTVTRLASVPTTTITVAGSSGTAGATITINSAGGSGNRPSVSSIRVNGVELMSGSSGASSNLNTIAANIASKITLNGFTATSSGNVVTIVGPTSANGYSPVLTYSGTMTYSVTAFPNVTATSVSSITVGGTQLLSATASGTTPITLANDIVAKISASGYSATASGSVITLTAPSSASNLTPVITVASGNMTLTTLAFPESTPSKLQNFANWYSYYSTRMLMMKTAAGRAFSDSTLAKYRIGFMSMNNNVSPGFVEVGTFTGSQKTNWYSKLYAANPGGNTPLREALSHVGQYYAHKFGAITTYTARITVGGSGTTSVASVTVNGKEILEDASAPGATNAQVAANIAAQINAVADTEFGAKVSSNVVTIYGPASAAGYAPLISSDGGGMTFSTTSFTGTTTTAQLNGVTPADPVQYSCQQNFTLLSTDGFWNGSTTYNLSNTTVDQQDGTAPRPMSDGALSSYTLTTTHTTVQRRQAETTGVVTTKVWTKTATAYGSNCSTAAVNSALVFAASLTDSFFGTNRTLWVAQSLTNPYTGSNTSRCYRLTNNGNAQDVWFCRSANDFSAPSSPPNSQTDSNGVTWGLASSISGYSSCVSSASALGGSSSTKGVCPKSAAVAKTNVVYTPYTQTETISGVVTTSVDDYTGTQTTTQTVTNGVPGAVGPFTPATPSYGAAVNVSSSSTAATSDTCGGQSAPCPSAVGTWTAGAATTVCTANTALPSAGTSTPVVTATSSTTGTTSTTILSTTTTAGPAVQSSVTTSGGTSNTLADVAMYYYQTDLRTPLLGNCTGALGEAVCENNVFGGSLDNQLQQHMTTFTLGLGATGRMVYSPSYMSDSTGDYVAVKNGCTAGTASSTAKCGDQASGTVCSWQTSGTVCNWPIPSSGALENIDDLWHAAVNGRGAYFSASNPTTLAAGLSNALAGIKTRKGAAAAAATSTLNPVAGNNYAYVASYTSSKWTGNLEARGINTITGKVGNSAYWCAESIQGDACSTGNIESSSSGNVSIQYCVTPSSVTCPNGTLDGSGNCKVEMVLPCTGTMMPRVKVTPASTTTIDGVGYSTLGDDRLIYTANDARTAFASFDDTYATNHSSYFDAANLSQASTWSTAKKTGASGVNLLRYLRGQKGLEDSSESATDGLFRYRSAVLGDALESLPAYLKEPVFSYPYPGYSDFLTAKASRAATVYMGTNDGMLHAFNASNGQERWAYVPSMVVPNMWHLADRTYSSNHINFVNGNAVTSDICVDQCTSTSSAVWKTILVGGLNGGGRGYYALDITDPSAPALMWEVSPSRGGTYQDLGYSFGPAVVTRKADGTWVVLVTSGYNNVSPGTGGGYLYVLNAIDGSIVSKIPTGVGDTTTPSGLSKVAAWNTQPAGNQAGYVYGGDLQGNLWRFDINSTLDATGTNAIGKGAVLDLAILKDSSGVTQPITTSPILGQILNKRVVFVGTGKYLESSDLTTTQVQTLYAIKDDDRTSTLTNPRASLVQQTVTAVSSGAATRTVSNNNVDFSTGDGWYIDLPETKERINVDASLVQGTLIVPSLVPDNTACSPAGHGWLNYFNYMTGGPVDSSDTTSSTLYDSPIVGFNVLYINGKPVVEVVTSSDPTPTVDENVKFKGGAASFSGKRVMWRELIQ